VNLLHIKIRDARNKLFILVQFRFDFEKNLDSVLNEFGSVSFKKRGSVRILLLFKINNIIAF